MILSGALARTAKASAQASRGWTIDLMVKGNLDGRDLYDEIVR
jgi:hypothetical protein